MVIVTFPDRKTAEIAIGFLLGRLSGRLLRSGECILPEAALEALGQRGLPFTVSGKATYDQEMAAIRSAASFPVIQQWRRIRCASRTR